MYTLLLNLHALLQEGRPSFYKENLISHLYEINGVENSDAICPQLGPLDIIYLPSLITYIKGAPASNFETGQTSLATYQMEGLALQDSQDPEEEMTIDPEDILLKDMGGDMRKGQVEMRKLTCHRATNLSSNGEGVSNSKNPTSMNTGEIATTKEKGPQSQKK